MLIELIIASGWYFIPITATTGNCSRVIRELEAMGYPSSVRLIESDRGISLGEGRHIPLWAEKYKYWTVKIGQSEFYCDAYSSNTKIAYRMANPDAAKIVNKALERLNIPRAKY